MCVAQSLQRILGVFVIHPTQKFQAVMVVAIKEMTGRKSVKIHWNLNDFLPFWSPDFLVHWSFQQLNREKKFEP